MAAHRFACRNLLSQLQLSRTASLVLVCTTGFVALAGLIGFAGQADANPATTDPTWFAAPPFAPPGAVISLVFSNTSPDTVRLVNSGPWWIEDSQGNTVRTAGIVLQAIFPIPPGGSWVWPWDQKDDNGAQVPVGSYNAKIGWLDANSGSHQASTAIVILGGVRWTASPDPVVAGTSLNLTLTNATTEDVSLDNTAPWWITDDNGTTVFVPFNSPAIQTIPAGGSRAWVWNLQNQSGQPFPPGNYVAHVTYRNAARTVRMEAEDPFTIVPTPPGVVVWEVTPRVNGTRSWILMTLTNATPNTIWLRNSAPWRIADANGQYVASASLAFQAIWPIPAGGTLAWIWDERYSLTNEYVPPGTYQAKIAYSLSESDTTQVRKIRSFRLVDPGCEFVSSPRCFYRPGETINFRFTNCLPDSVAMPCSQAWWITTAWGQPVYWPYVTWAWTFWGALQGFDFAWPNQMMYNNMQAPPGEYLAWAYFTDKLTLTRYLASSLPITILTPAGQGEPDDATIRLGLDVYPNPPRPAATVRFRIPDGRAPIDLAVADVTGRVVVEQALGVLDAGTHEIAWPQQDQAGRRLPAGTYFCVLRAGGLIVAEKVVLLR